MMKAKKGMQLCVCGHYEKKQKGFFSKIDVISGTVVLSALAVFLLIQAIDVLTLILLPLLLASWSIFFIVWIVKGHSLVCAARWAASVVIGAVGGSWFLGV